MESPSIKEEFFFFVWLGWMAGTWGEVAGGFHEGAGCGIVLGLERGCAGLAMGMGLLTTVGAGVFAPLPIYEFAIS